MVRVFKEDILRESSVNNLVVKQYVNIMDR